MPQLTIRLNGQIRIQYDGEAADCLALLARYSEEGLRFRPEPEELARLANEEPERLIALALACETHDPERPGRVSYWLLPGWKFDVDFRAGQDGLDIVVTTFEPKHH